VRLDLNQRRFLIDGDGQSLPPRPSKVLRFGFECLRPELRGIRFNHLQARARENLTLLDGRRIDAGRNFLHGNRRLGSRNWIRKNDCLRRRCDGFRLRHPE